ncbi:unnamed protein product, partial [Mesorhabditis belari]|uniref:ribonuclease H n=1 Tax=Mesorhabditis belari TaxID=2138241 RepID=A0AAF3F712_9BILA
MQRLIRSVLDRFSQNGSSTNLKNSLTASSSATSNAAQEIYPTLPNASPSKTIITLPSQTRLASGADVHRYSRESYGFEARNESTDVPFYEEFPPNAIVVYTDASCIRGIATGIANFFGNDHPLNLSMRLNLNEHNSGKGEIYATTMALHRVAHWEDYNGELVIVRTDYLNTLVAMRKGNNSAFAMDYDNLRCVAAWFPLGVEFQWVKAHNGDPGNEMADTMAKNAIGKDRIGRSSSVELSRSSRNRSRTQSRRRVRSNSPFLKQNSKRRSQSREDGILKQGRLSRIDTIGSVDAGYGSRGSSVSSTRSDSSQGYYDDWSNGERKVLIRGGKSWRKGDRPQIIYPHQTPIIPYLQRFKDLTILQ